MTRKTTAELLPIMEAFAKGKKVLVYDNSALSNVWPYERGVWVELTNIGFGRPLEWYKIVEDEKEDVFGALGEYFKP